MYPKNTLKALIAHTKQSVENALLNRSALTEEVLGLEGMSGNKTRHFYNNLCSWQHITSYLEVGTWKGSSFISAMFNNDHVHGTSIDNWSEFGGPKNDFLENVDRFLVKDKITVLDKDCWSISPADVQAPIDIFLYDGGHNFELQKKAITHFYPMLAKYAIILVDDWSCDWVDVKKGTLAGLKKSPLKIHYKKGGIL